MNFDLGPASSRHEARRPGRRSGEGLDSIRAFLSAKPRAIEDDFLVCSDDQGASGPLVSVEPRSHKSSRECESLRV
jgi:hypothetical protein